MKIAVTTGDPAGIGPDVALLHAFAPDQGLGTQSAHADQLVFIGDREALCERAGVLGLECETPMTQRKKFTLDLRKSADLNDYGGFPNRQ